jgi:hypothetical protein
MTLFIAFLIPMNPVHVASASPTRQAAAQCPSGCWTPVYLQTPSYVYQSGIYVVLAVEYSSSFNTTTSGTVFANFRNYTGALVAHASGNLTIPPHANAIARLTVFGIQVGLAYDLAYFAADASGKNISTTTADHVYVADQSPLQGQEPLSMITSYICNYPCAELSSYPVVMVTYKNTLSSPLGLVIMHGVVRLGNTVSKNDNQTLVTLFDAAQSKTIPFYVGSLGPGVYDLSTFATMTNGSALSGVSDVNFQVLTNGSLFIGQAGDWTLVKGPTLSYGGDNPVVEATYTNNLNFTVTGISFLMIHNGVGQTIAYSTATLIPPGGGNATAYNVVFGLPPGTYHATVFVTSVSWVALSGSSSFTFTLH